jgi:hypothetical protein
VKVLSTSGFGGKELRLHKKSIHKLLDLEGNHPNYCFTFFFLKKISSGVPQLVLTYLLKESHVLDFLGSLHTCVIILSKT